MKQIIGQDESSVGRVGHANEDRVTITLSNYEGVVVSTGQALSAIEKCRQPTTIPTRTVQSAVSLVERIV